MNHPSVSFIVPCYNFAHFLPQCVNSILAQSYPDFEVVIMDNCSPDDTPDVARSFDDSRVRYIRNPENIGPQRNFNKGIGASRGKYTWVIAADDWLASADVLGRYVALMERDDDIAYVFCRAREWHADHDAGIVAWADCGDSDRVWEGVDFRRRLIDANCIVMSSVMARKKCYDEVCLFPPELPYAADWHQWVFFSLSHRVGYFAEPMVYFRVHEGSLTSSFSSDYERNCLSDEIEVLQRIAREAVGRGDNSAIAMCRAAVVQRYMASGDRLYWRGDRENAVKAYRRALRVKPAGIEVMSKLMLTHLGAIGDSVRRMLSPHQGYQSSSSESTKGD